MRLRLFFSFCIWLIAVAPALAQQRLYPVRGTIPVEKNPYEEDHFYFVVEKPFEYKFTLGFPTSDQAQFVRGTDASIVVLWLRIENLSNQPLKINADSFAATGSDGHALARLDGGEAFDRIVSGKGFTG